MDRVVYSLDDGDARRFFEYAGFRARNLSDPLRRAGSTLLHHINLTFATEGAWIGDKWPPLSRGYRLWKEEHFPGKPMLVLTGRLRREAIARKSTRVVGDELIWQIDVPYAEIMQDGATWVDVNHRGEPHVVKIPPRPFIEVTPALVEEIEEDFRGWLEELKARNRARASLQLTNPFD